MPDPPSQMSKPFVQPSGLEVDFDKNITPLYEAITSCNWEKAITEATKNPIQAKTWVVRHYDDEDSDGQEQEIMWRFLPIHSACARQPPAAVITALLHAYPDGAKCIDDQGMFALHYACGNQASREVIRSLLMSFPDAAKLKDPRGMLPIHYLACWGPSSISVVDMVLVANRDVGGATDEDGNTPLDLANEGDYPERAAVIAALKRWLENSGSSGSSSRHIVTEEKKEQDENIYATSPNKVGRLRKELADAKKNQRLVEGAWEGRMTSQQNAFTDQISKLEHKVHDLSLDCADGQQQIADLQRKLQEKEMALQRTKAELRHSNDERDGLRQTLADLTEQHDKFKKRSEILGDRLGSLNASLFSMMEQQNVVLDAMSAREEQWNALSDLRREKMKELVALEEQESKEEVELKTCLMKQTKEMEAISAVIAAVRQQG